MDQRAATARRSLVTGVAGVALLSCVAALLLGGGRPAAVPAGLPDAGALTAWGLRCVRLLSDLAAVLTVGTALVGAVLLPGAGPDRAARAVGRWALLWSASALGLAVLTVSDTTGVAVPGLAATDWSATLATGRVRGLLAAALVAAGVALAARRVRTARGARLLLVAAVAGTLPAAATGHATTAADAATAVAAVAVHVVAASLWVGGLVALLVHLGRDRDALVVALPRFSTLALGCYLVLAGSGAIAAVSRLGTDTASWTSGYAALLAAKVSVLVVLGAVGQRHRRDTLGAALRGRPAALLRLAGGEVVLMGVGLGLAAALAETPPPVPVAAAAHAAGESAVPWPVPPFTPAHLLTAWRANAVVLVLLGLLLAAYLAGARTLGRSGAAWAGRRTAAFAAGVAVAVLDLCSGVATYAAAMVSVHVAQLLVALLVVPALLALGRPLTMWQQVDAAAGRTPRTAALLDRATRRPLVGALAVCALLLGVYRTPLVEWSVRSTWLSLALLAAAVLAGLALWVPVLTGARESGGAAAAVVGTLGVLAAQLGLSDRLLAGRWFRELRWSWVDPVADQRVAALVVVAAVVLVILGVALGAVVGGAVGARLPRAQRSAEAPASSPRTGGQTRTTTLPSSASAPTAP